MSRTPMFAAAGLFALGLFAANAADAQLPGKRTADASVEAQLGTAPKVIGGKLTEYQTFKGQLAAGGSASHKVTTRAGGFQMIGVCDDACGSLTIKLRDKGGAILAEPLVADLFPLIYVDVEDKTELTLDVTINNCKLDSCLYALRAYHKEGKRED